MRNFPSHYSTEPIAILADQRVPFGQNEAFFKAISRKPDRQIYLNFDLIAVDDPETQQHDLYPFGTSTTTWLTATINRVKFLQPSLPPLLNWDDMNRVNFW